MLTVPQDIKILIVDDVTDNIQLAMNILREENYQFSFATDGIKALNLIEDEKFDLILLDVMMPMLDGFEVCKQIKEKKKNRETPIIFLTAKSDIDSLEKAFELGAVDYVIKPFQPGELLARVRTHVDLYHSRELLRQANEQLEVKTKLQSQRLKQELEENQKEMIYALMEMMESTSDETGQHIRRVAEHSKLLAHYSESLSEEDEMIVYYAAPMHDIGKIAIPKEILHKPGKLTEAEFAIMKTHAEKAEEFLKYSHRKLLRAASIIATQHHEKWDGSGYPKGLKGNDIHIYGRIVALADVFDALTHKRRYKEAWGIDEAVEYVKQHSETQFDPVLVEIFTDHLPEFIEIAKIA
ncbi:MAG: response regulator [Kangiellaceae bacterium]|nr:response regulator [Kangiellaceae bacterium]